jgi:hypothetical protein
MFKIVVGHSDDPDSLSAIEDVISQCLEDLSGEIPQAGILFCAIEFDYALILKALRQQFPNLELIGCTSDGEVSSKLEFQEDSLTLTLFCSDQITIRAGISPNLSQDSDIAAQQAITNAQGLTDQTRLCLTLPDGLTANGVTVTKALAKALGPQVVLAGGTAADQWNFDTTYQFCSNADGEQILSDSLPILLFSGDLLISHGVSSGWQPISRMGVVTRSEGSIVYEIDHQPTTDFYQFYLTSMDLNQNRLTGEYPLAVFESEDAEDFYLRAPISDNHLLGQSISFRGDVPQGSRVQVTHATGDELIAATQLSIEQAHQNYPGTLPAGLLIFSCAARRCLLGPRAREEYDLCQKVLDPNFPVCGFYSYGEIAPMQSKGKTYYHQETFVTLMLGVE